MPANGQSNPQKISRLEILNTSLKANLGDVPYVAADQAQLDDVVNRAKALQSLQESHRSQGQDSTKQLFDLIQTGNELRGRIRASLQGHYGVGNLKLIEFGLKPLVFTGRRSKKKKPAVPVTPAPAAPEAATPTGKP